MIFFHDKNWFHAQPHPLDAVAEEDEDLDAADPERMPSSLLAASAFLTGVAVVKGVLSFSPR